MALTPRLWKRRRQQSGELRQRIAELEDELRAVRGELVIARTRFEQVLQSSGEGLFFIDLAKGRLIDINRRAEELLGYSYDEIEHVRLDSLFSRQHQRRFWRLVATVRRTGKAAATELQFRRKDGSLFVGSVQAGTGLLGERPVVHGSLRDLTPAVNLATELRRHNRRLRLVNTIAQRVAEGDDLQTTLEIVLSQVIDSLDVSGGGIFLVQNRGSEMQLAIHHDIPEDVLIELRQLQPGEGLAGKVAVTGKPRLSTNLQNDWRRHSRAVAGDNWRTFLAVPMISEETTLGVLFIFNRGQQMLNREDIRLLEAIGRQVGPLVKNAELISELSWQQRLNEASLREIERSRATLADHVGQLEESHRMLESLDQMKSTFLALASHELRTPLTSILSGAELLQSLPGTGDAATQCAVAAVLHGSNRLNRIVDDLLEAARLEARTLYLAREHFDPRPLVDTLLAEYAAACQERQIDCRIQRFPQGVSLHGDAHHLQRALGRLLENAIKFTPAEGCIRLSGAIQQQQEILAQADRLRRFSPGFFTRPMASHYLAISIDDTGIGLDPSEQVRIFDKFYEVGDITCHSTSNGRFGGKGVGLGLTLTKGMIEAHNGLIWVESAGPHQGSRFAVLLPLAMEPDP
ncbi:MAG: GAF domain-containing protein [Desulfuromonadales bacterium]|nr:GAF domain-containing protein [Desulfuromonadales bacterium]